MKFKAYFITALALILLAFGGLSLFVIREDPFFLFSPPGQEERYVNHRYEMAGLIRSCDYDAVIMGTSLAANYRASWFTEGLGQDTLKITFPDGWIPEFDKALDLAFRQQGELSTVCFSLDPNTITRSPSQKPDALPEYLYDRSALNDVEYLLSADTYQLIGRDWLLGDEGKTSLDEAYIWDGSHIFSYGYALAGYPRPAVSDTVLPNNAYIEAAEENLDIICSWVEKHPGTTFKIWFPPYSVLYWDKCLREGTANAVLAAVDYAGHRLLDYPNVELYCFLWDYPVITDLNNYTDHIHCSGDTTHHVAGQVMGGSQPLTREEFYKELEALSEFVINYDYTAIFPEKQEGK